MLHESLLVNSIAKFTILSDWPLNVSVRAVVGTLKTKCDWAVMIKFSTVLVLDSQPIHTLCPTLCSLRI